MHPRLHGILALAAFVSALTAPAALAQSCPPPDDADYVSKIGAEAFEPPDPVKGDLARAHFYFALMYPDRVDALFFERELPDLLAWHLADPPSREEMQRDSVIQAIQGNCNPFVRWPGLVGQWIGADDSRKR